METYIVRVNGEEFEVEIEKQGGDQAEQAGHRGSNLAAAARERVAERAAERADRIADRAAARKSGGKASGEPVVCGTAGSVFKVVAHEGQEVKAGDTIIVLEAMKMEIPVVSPKDGKVSKIIVSEGNATTAGQTVAYVE